MGFALQGDYISIKDLGQTTAISFNVMSQYNPSPRFLILLEFAQLNVNTKQQTSKGEIKDDFWESVLFLGAGYQITNKISVGSK